jgi:hypothetical protein
MLKKYNQKVDDFFRWIKGTELVELQEIDVSEDPVRPKLDLEFRTSYGRKIYGLKYEDTIEGIVCVAFTEEVPETEKELELMSKTANLENNPTIAIAYTVWSRKRGAGREIILKLKEYIDKELSHIKRVVTLSPLTPMATHFHIRNGAKLIKISSTTQNFEYK